MTTQPINQQIQQGIFSQANSIMNRYSFNLPSIAQKLNKIAVPAIALFVFSNLTGALAGPLEYSGCVMGCTLFATPVAFPGCVTACLPLLFLPGP